MTPRSHRVPLGAAATVPLDRERPILPASLSDVAERQVARQTAIKLVKENDQDIAG